MATPAATAFVSSPATSVGASATTLARHALPVSWRGDLPPQSSLPILPDGSVDYSSIDRNPVSQLLMGTVRSLVAQTVGRDSETPGFAGMIELVREVNDMEGTAEELQQRARGVFEGILPALGLAWIPQAWRDHLQGRVPAWSTNYAFFLVFYYLFPWLMGPMEGEDYVDIEVPRSWRRLFFFLPASLQLPQTAKAERCRFLEQAQCASVCVNSCKVPSQQWLTEDFGMPLHIQPNYDDFSCRWSFGKEAPPLMEDEAIMTPCFTKCPSKVKGTKDALASRRRLQAEEAARADSRLAAAVEGLTPDGTALSAASLETRSRVVGQAGKCWSVDDERQFKRSGS